LPAGSVFFLGHADALAEVDWSQQFSTCNHGAPGNESLLPKVLAQNLTADIFARIEVCVANNLF